MKKRVAGTMMVGAVILGMYLANFWKGPGLGGTGTDSGSIEAPADQTPVSTNANPTIRPVNPPGVADAAEQKHITVVVHGGEYRLASYEHPETGMDVALDTVVIQAIKMKGDDKGVKVYILLEKNAQEGALADLHATLKERGVKQGEIVEISEFVN